MGHELADWLCAIDAIAAPSIADARHLRQRDGGTVLEALVRLGAISDQSLTLLLRERLRLPIVAPGMLASIPADALAAMPADMAVEFRAMPLSIDTEGNLLVAFSDPSDVTALEEISFFTGRHVMRTIAMQSQIAWCLARYFGVVTPLAEPLLVPNEQGGQQRQLTQPSNNPATAERADVQPLTLPKKRAPRITEEMVDAPRRGPLPQLAPPSPPASATGVGTAGIQHPAASTGRLVVGTDIAVKPEELAPRKGEFAASSPRLRRLTDLPPVMIDLDQLGNAASAPIPAHIVDEAPAPDETAPLPPLPSTPSFSRTRARSETVVGYASPQAIERVAVTKHLTRDLTSATRAIASAPNRDLAIAEFLRSMYSDHIVLCIVRGDAVTVHPTTGAYVPLTSLPSIGAAVARSRPYRGPLPDAQSQQFATTHLGQFMPLVVIVPIVLRDRAIAFSLAELTSRTPDDSELIALAQVTANAFARLAVARRTTGE